MMKLFRSSIAITLCWWVRLSCLHCWTTAWQSDTPSLTASRPTPAITFGEPQWARRRFLACTAVTPVFLLQSSPQITNAFEGGVGGLGKTKPETGVEFLSPPFQSKEGWVSAEVLAGSSSPLLIEFLSPSLPLLPTSAGLEVRQLPDPESAYCHIINDSRYPQQRRMTKQDVVQLLEQHILSRTGKFGAYLTPTDVKVASADPENGSLWKVSFTAYTPGLRESDRKLLLNVQRVGTSSVIVVLVAGTTLQRYAKQEAKLRQIVESFRVVPAPSTKLRS